MADMKIDPERVWFKSPTVLTILCATVFATGFYFQVGNSFERLEKDSSDKWALFSSKLTEVGQSVNDLRVELQRIAVGFVATRQADQWIMDANREVELWRKDLLLNNPTLKVGALVLPGLPK